MHSIAATLVVFLCASWTSNVVAGQGQSESGSGIIHFSGSLVEDPCTSQVQQQQLKVLCQRNGQTNTSTQGLDITKSQSLPFNLGTSQFHWVDRKQMLGVVAITYL